MFFFKTNIIFQNWMEIGTSNFHQPVIHKVEIELPFVRLLKVIRFLNLKSFEKIKIIKYLLTNNNMPLIEEKDNFSDYSVTDPEDNSFNDDEESDHFTRLNKDR